jgi:hypothetical protein
MFIWCFFHPNTQATNPETCAIIQANTDRPAFRVIMNFTSFCYPTMAYCSCVILDGFPYTLAGRYCLGKKDPRQFEPKTYVQAYLA